MAWTHDNSIIISLFSLALSSISARNVNLLKEPLYLEIYSGNGWLQGLVWKMEAPNDKLLTLHRLFHFKKKEERLVLVLLQLIGDG